MTIEAGDRLPPFEGHDEKGTLRRSSDLLGKVSVLFFYLKDNTPGCTREACDFRDAANELQARGVTVIGISPDTVVSHKQFADSHRLGFPLLSDSDLSICSALKVVRPGPRIERTTFIVDEKGIVRWVERSVHIEEHISRVLMAIDSLESL
jgi:peroxiredoxin Q/BCP